MCVAVGDWVEPGAVAGALCVIEDGAVEIGGVVAELI